MISILLDFPICTHNPLFIEFFFIYLLNRFYFNLGKTGETSSQEGDKDKGTELKIVIYLHESVLTQQTLNSRFSLFHHVLKKGKNNGETFSSIRSEKTKYLLV